MKLGDKIQNLRKKEGLSQEQLGEKVNVTRQTISNWELDITAPNPDQLKLLSKTLNVSIDELLDNDIKGVIEEKISNTEKLAGIILKILKVIGILFLVFLVIDIISFIMFAAIRKGTKVSNTDSVEISCTLNDKDYLIEVGSDGYFNCSNCSLELQKDLKDNYIDFSDLDNTANKISNYFEDNEGTCD